MDWPCLAYSAVVQREDGWIRMEVEEMMKFLEKSFGQRARTRWSFVFPAILQNFLTQDEITNNLLELNLE